MTSKTARLVKSCRRMIKSEIMAPDEKEIALALLIHLEPQPSTNVADVDYRELERRVSALEVMVFEES